MPFETISPYITYATEQYLYRYIGKTLHDALIDHITTNEPEPDVPRLAKLLELCKRVVGPLAIALGTDELSIMIGDTGHTVTKSEVKSPASDAKIALARESAFRRGFDAIENLLLFLEANKDLYPEWAESRYCLSPRCVYLKSAEEFQSYGFVDIEYSRLTYEKISSMLLSLEYSLAGLLPAGVEAKLRTAFSGTLEGVDKSVIDSIRVYLANKTAQLHTSQTTREQRSAPGTMEFKAIIRPIYEDSTANGNYYGTRATSALQTALLLINTNAAYYGLETPVAFDYNKIENKIFVA